MQTMHARLICVCSWAGSPIVFACQNSFWAVQYTAKFHGEKVKRYLHKQNGQLGIQYFRPRQAPPETSEKLTGYKSGSVTPVGLKTPMPLILSHEIDQLQPSYFWMGGGEQLLKLGMSVQEFKQAYAPYVVDCTY